MADNIKVKVKDPRTSEFRKDQIVINTKEGTLFYKSQQGLHELVSTGLIVDNNNSTITTGPTLPVNWYPLKGLVFPLHYSESLELASASIDENGYALFQSASIAGWTINPDSIQKPGVFEINSVDPGTGNNYILSSSFFNVNDLGKVDATAGRIGGWELGPTFLSASNGSFIISSNISGQYFLSASNFQVSTTGDITASAGQIGGFEIDDHSITTTGVEINNSNQALFISSSNLQIDHEGNITASNVDLSGNISATTGNIGGFAITENALTGSNFFLSGAASTGTEFFISASGFNIKGDGIFSASAGLIGGFEIDDHSITTTGVEINNSTQTLFISSSNFKVEHNGAITGSQVLFTGGDIGGFTIDSTSLVGGNLQLFSVGQIKSADYISSPEPLVGKGFNLSVGVDGLGFLEVGNARIRGTLSTMVFEKETVNAVGGALYVANSTVISASAWSGSFVAATDTTMSVQHVGGFTASEFCTIKKANNTGFSTEYIKIVSTSRYYPTSDTDFTGKLFIERGIGVDSTTVNSSSLGGLAAQSQSYTGSQVIVSTGREDTGYVFINANPNDPSTPYIDIAERTGSALYDIALKVRLGDLSGLANTAPVNTATPGFGLMSENVFLSGHITASSGLIGGFNILETALQAGDVFQLSSSLNLDDPVSFISSSNFKVSAGGVMTASAALIGGFTIDDDHIHDTAGNLQLTGSTGTIKAILGEIGGFVLGPTTISSSANVMILDAEDESIQVGDITAQGIKISGSAAKFILTKAGKEAVVIDDNVDGNNPGIRINEGTLFVSASTDLSSITSFNDSASLVTIIAGDQGTGTRDNEDRASLVVGMSDTSTLNTNYTQMTKTQATDVSGSGVFSFQNPNIGTFAAGVFRAEVHQDVEGDNSSANGANIKVPYAIIASATSSIGITGYSFLGEDGVMLNKKRIQSNEVIVSPRFVSKMNVFGGFTGSGTAEFTGSFHGDGRGLSNITASDVRPGSPDTGISASEITVTTFISASQTKYSIGGNVTSPPQTFVHVGASSNETGSFEIKTDAGYVLLGPKSVHYSHFYTDRERYYFDEELTIDTGSGGGAHIRSHNGPLKLQADFGDEANNQDQLVLGDGVNGHVGIKHVPLTSDYKFTVGGGARIGYHGNHDKIVMKPGDFNNRTNGYNSTTYWNLSADGQYYTIGGGSYTSFGAVTIAQYNIPMGYQVDEIDWFVSFNSISNLTNSQATNNMRLDVFGNEFDSPSTSTVTTLVNDENLFATTGHKNAVKKYSITFNAFADGENSVVGNTMRYITVTHREIDSRFRYFGGFLHLSLI